jgi:hypothetical protein
MSKLDDKIRQRMKNIVYRENRAFSFLDFADLLDKGTFRNKMCYIFKDEVERVCYSPMAFYTLKGHKFYNSMTDSHTVGTTGTTFTVDPVGTTSTVDPGNTSATNKTNTTISNLAQGNTNDSFLSTNSKTYLCNLPIYHYIKNIPWRNRSIHDIRLRFEGKGLWSLLASSSRFQIFPSNNDILIIKLERDDLNVKVTVHKTDTVSVTVGCTFAPVELDINGLIRLSNALAITEDRIKREIEDSSINKTEQQVTAPSLSVPNYGSWLITMWHFGRDASITYEKKEFCIEYRIAHEIVYRIYDKEWRHDKKRRIRFEKQEYPNKSFAEAMEEQLNK